MYAFRFILVGCWDDLAGLWLDRIGDTGKGRGLLDGIQRGQYEGNIGNRGVRRV